MALKVSKPPVDVDAIFLSVLERALDFSPIRGLGVRDILFDPASLTVALYGPAISFERALKFPIYNRGQSLNLEWGRLFDIPVQLVDNGSRPQWFHGYPDVVVPDFLPEIEGAILGAWEHASGTAWSGPEMTVTLMPEPGYPWTKGQTDLIYSAKKRKWFKTETPPWLMFIKDRDGETRPAVDFCAIAPRLDTPIFEGSVGVLEGQSPYIVTHTTSFANKFKVDPDKLALMSKCNGLLYPSFATGLIPAANFGETCLVMNASLPLAGMRPYHKRGAWSVVTYSSDTWTEGLGSVLMDSAIQAFLQLHGHPNFYYTNHFHVLGPEVKDEGFGGAAVKPITSIDKMASAMRRKFRSWTPDLSFKQFQKLSNLDRYAYLETKAQCIVDWSMVDFAVCPLALASQCEPGLRRIGFQGPIEWIDADPAIIEAYANDNTGTPLEEREYQKYRYAWMVAGAIRESRYTRIFNVEG